MKSLFSVALHVQLSDQQSRVVVVCVFLWNEWDVLT